MGEGVKIGGGTSLAIDGLEQMGELKLTTKRQWVSEFIPQFPDSGAFPTTCFSYKNEIHGTYGTTHKKLLNGVWVDDVSFPVAPPNDKGGFCEDEDGNLYFAVTEKIYKFNGTEWTNIITINAESGAYNYVGNLIYDKGKLYYSYGQRVRIIDLNTLSYKATSICAISSSYTTYCVGKIFVLKGSLYAAATRAGGYYFGNISKYDETSDTWDKVGYIHNGQYSSSTSANGGFVPIVMEDGVLISAAEFAAIFDGSTVKRAGMYPQSAGNTFKSNGQYYFYASNGLYLYRKVLCLEV